MTGRAQMNTTFVIVGASLAGGKAAETLREEGYDGRVVLIGAEPERPYERPPLTKDYLRGESERANAYVHPEGFYAEQGIELLTGVTVTAIDPGASRVTLDDGRTLGYGRLLLTTGAEPRRLRIPGADLDGVCYLRTLADCDLLRARLAAGGRVAVVGAGWIGSEFAASARQRGLEVTVIGPQALPNERIFGSEVASFYRDVHDSRGVELLLGDGVESFEGTGAITLNSQIVVNTPRIANLTLNGLDGDDVINLSGAVAFTRDGVRPSDRPLPPAWPANSKLPRQRRRATSQLRSSQPDRRDVLRGAIHRAAVQRQKQRPVPRQSQIRQGAFRV